MSLRGYPKATRSGDGETAAAAAAAVTLARAAVAAAVRLLPWGWAELLSTCRYFKFFFILS